MGPTLIERVCYLIGPLPVLFGTRASFITILLPKIISEVRRVENPFPFQAVTESFP
jgi:hypothetical protein